MRFFRWLGKFGTYYREYGFLWLVHHVRVNLVHYNQLVILETDVRPDYLRVDAKSPVSIRLLTTNKEDIDRLTKFWPADEYVPRGSTRANIKDIIIKRLDAGEICAIAESDGRIIHMNWIGLYQHHVFDSYEEKRGLAPGEALSHSTYCARDYRGNHIMSAVRSWVIDYLLKNDYKNLINYVDPDNHAAMKVTENFGGRPVQKLHSLKVLGYNFLYMTRRDKSIPGRN